MKYGNLAGIWLARINVGIVQGFESKLEKRVKGKWGPSGRKLLLCFVDDLSMPKPDEFGSQPPLELLRHFLDYGCW